MYIHVLCMVLCTHTHTHTHTHTISHAPNTCCSSGVEDIVKAPEIATNHSSTVACVAEYDILYIVYMYYYVLQIFIYT